MDEREHRIGEQPGPQRPAARPLEELTREARERDAAQNRRVEELYANAEARRGFSAYEGNAITSKQALQDLCQEYALFCGGDALLKDFLGRVEKYAALDAPTGKPYEEEAAFIRSLPGVMDDFAARFEKEEAALQADIQKAFPNGAPAEMTEEQRQQDRLLTARAASLENRRRIVASLGVYFDTLTTGSLSDSPTDRKYEDPVYEQRLQEAHASTYKTVELPDGNGGMVWYLNAAGQELDASIQGDSVPGIAKTLGNLAAHDERKPDAPLFPHEPRMNDVKQMLAGECYLYAALQDIARLYPQKLKDAVKDNGDGTATVRFFERFTNRDGSKTYTPVFVRVDKGTSKLGAWERGGQDSMWVNAIERGYAMSGMHLTERRDHVRPVNTDELKSLHASFSQPGIILSEHLREEFPWLIERVPVRGTENAPRFTYRLKDWKPSVASIEGGNEAEFLETLLGPDFRAADITIPLPAPERSFDREDERQRDETWKRRVELVKPAQNNVRQRIRFALSERIPEAELDRFMNAPEEEMLRMAYQHDIYKDMVSEEGFVQTVREVMDAAEIQITELKDRQGGTLTIHNNMDMSEAISAQVHPNDRALHSLALSKVNELNISMRYSQRDPVAQVFEDVADKLEKGFPVSAGSRPERRGETMPVADTHAYSIVGAFKTADDPPRCYFRMRNPWGGRHVLGSLGDTLGLTKNGLRYQTDSNGRETAGWTHMEEGVFDIDVKDFLKYFDNLRYNGSENLEHTPHLRTEGYDIITPAQARQQADRTVTGDAFTNYARAANDIYAALLGTDSRFSNDSPQYQALRESVQAFRDAVGASRGRSMDVLKQAADSLQEKAQAYLDHVPKSPSSRQQARMNVCKTIMAVTLAAQSGSKEPAKEIEAQFARRLMEANFKAQKKPVPAELDTLAEKLAENRAFRTVAGKLNLNQMLNAGDAVLKKGLQELSTAAKGRGVDKGLDLNTMKTKDYTVKL